jgi:hypothetical protein
MLARALEWKSYEVSAHAGNAPRTLETAALTEEQFTVEIPDLSGWPGPRDKARILLETAAEVEHALLVSTCMRLSRSGEARRSPILTSSRR